MAGYYKKIKGKDYDARLLGSAESAVKGRGDGRISMNDAKRIFAIVRDAGVYSDIEKRTMSYIRDNFDFTKEADSWFRTEIRRWAALKGAGKKAAPKPAAKAKPKPAAKARPKPAAKARPKPAAKARPKPAAPVRRPSSQERLAAITPPERGVTMREERPAMTAPVKKRSFGKFLIFIIILLGVILIVLVARKRLSLDFLTRGGGEKAIPKREQQMQPADTGTIAEKAVGEVQEPEPPAGREKGAAEPVKETQVLVETDEYGVYTVGVKDSLISISEKVTGDYRNWSRIFQANRDRITRPTMIYPGQQLRIPKNR